MWFSTNEYREDCPSPLIPPPPSFTTYGAVGRLARIADARGSPSTYLDRRKRRIRGQGECFELQRIAPLQPMLKANHLSSHIMHAGVILFAGFRARGLDEVLMHALACAGSPHHGKHCRTGQWKIRG